MSYELSDKMILKGELMKYRRGLCEQVSEYGYGYLRIDRRRTQRSTAEGYCIAVVREMAGENNDAGRVHSVSGKRIGRRYGEKQKSTSDIEVSDGIEKMQEIYR